MPSAAVDTRVRGYDKYALCHPRLDRGAMPSAAVDTRVRGYDKR